MRLREIHRISRDPRGRPGEAGKAGDPLVQFDLANDIIRALLKEEMPSMCSVLLSTQPSLTALACRGGQKDPCSDAREAIHPGRDRRGQDQNTQIAHTHPQLGEYPSLFVVFCAKDNYSVGLFMILLRITRSKDSTQASRRDRKSVV